MNSTLIVGGVVVIVIIIIALIYLNYPSSKSPAPAPAPAPVPSPAPVEEAVDELEVIKGRLHGMEQYSTREHYRSPNGNNAATIIGTFLEQIIDVTIAVLKQPLVKETVNKRLSTPADAAAVAAYIEIIGKNLTESLKTHQLLQCESEGKDNNCDVYMKNIGNDGEYAAYHIASNLYNALLAIVSDKAEQDKMYSLAQRYETASLKDRPDETPMLTNQNRDYLQAEMFAAFKTGKPLTKAEEETREALAAEEQANSPNDP